MSIFKYCPLPWEFRYTEQDGAAIFDKSGHMVLIFMWPQHGIEETKNVEEAVEGFAKRIVAMSEGRIIVCPKCGDGVGNVGGGNLACLACGHPMGNLLPELTPEEKAACDAFDIKRVTGNPAPGHKRQLRVRCDRCDGCGWIEGGYEQPVCPMCKGEGMVAIQPKRVPSGKPAAQGKNPAMMQILEGHYWRCTGCGLKSQGDFADHRCKAGR